MIHLLYFCFVNKKRLTDILYYVKVNMEFKEDFNKQLNNAIQFTQNLLQ